MSIEAQSLRLRNSLLRLRDMGRHLIDGAPATLAAQASIWQLAEEIADQLNASVAEIADSTRFVERLAHLLRRDR